MSIFLVGMSMLSSFIKMILLFIVFVLILIASYFFTKWYAKSGLIKNQTRNIQLLEGFSIAPGKQVLILRIGKHYVAVASCKDQVSLLMELNEDELVLEDAENPPFKEMHGFGELFQEIIKKRAPQSDGKGLESGPRKADEALTDSMEPDGEAVREPQEPDDKL